MPCPACEHPIVRTFYEVDDIPVQSNLLVRDLKQSQEYPTANVHLAQCEKCGFITNVAFDESRLMMSTDYEATQGHSPTFGKFARTLAQQWIEKYNLTGKTIVEIGCGQGEFLELICELAGARGIGFDPVIRTTQSTRVPSVTFVQDVFSSAKLPAKPDFICCRHTLEHIAQPLEFLRTVREHCGSAIVAIEVPDTVRVLQEGAFWDIYYEHNSYFTPDSLARTLQRAGFEILDTSLQFDGQYLIAECKAGEVVEPENAKLSELRLTQVFTRQFEDLGRRWQELAAGFAKHQQRAVIWGSGSKAVGFVTTLKLASAFAAVVDINPAKQNTFLPGTALEIIAPDKLKAIQPHVVVVMNPIYKREIEAQLASLGLSPLVMAL